MPARYQKHHVKNRQHYFEKPKLRPMGQGLELFGQHKDGHEFLVEISLSPIETEEGLLVLANVRDITERKQAENALKVSELRFRTMAEAMPQVVWITRPDGWNIYFNQQWVDYTGLTLEESYGHGWNKPFHPDDQQRAWDAWQQAVHNNGKYSLECRLRRKDGIYRWWLVRGVPLHDESGNITQWFGTCTDINDIKQAENALKESEERFRGAFEAATHGIALVSLEGKFIKVNESLCAMLGYGNVELLATDLQTIIHPEELTADLNSLHQLVERKTESLRVENRFMHKKGNVIWVLLGVSLMRTNEEVPVHFVFQVQDITQSKVVERELRIAAATFETYDAIMITDADVSIIKVNKAFTRITGFCPEEVLGKNPRIMKSGHHDKLFYVEMFHKLQNDGTWEGEIWDKRKDDEIYPLWMVITAIKDAQQKIVQYVSIFRDITERKKAEDAKAILLALVESSDEAIIGKDLKGTIFSWNKAAELLYGYTEAEIIGCSIKKLFPTDKHVEFDQIIQQIVHGEHIKHRESFRVHKDGHIIPVSITISPIKNAKGDVIGASTTARDITQQKMLEEKLRHLAEHDPLTGLINRPLFEDRLEQAILLATRENYSIAVFFVDIDDFKGINDLYGHATGDLLLCAATKRIQTCIRDVDAFARLGGDEFALILLDIKTEENVINIAKEVIQRFSEEFLIENKTIKVTLSIGISLYPRDGHQSLIEKADSAMYYVKNHGKNNFKLFDTSLQLGRK